MSDDDVEYLALECEGGYPLRDDAIAAGAMLRKQAAEIDRLRAALSAQPAAAPGWQPIEAAPPANETLLLVVDGRVTTGDYFPPFGWNWDELDDEPEDARPTHWMHLPAAPQAPQQDEAQNAKGEEHGPEEATEAPARLHRSSKEPGAVGGGDQLA